MCYRVALKLQTGDHQCMTQPARGEHGRALMAFLNQEVEALGESPTGWARRNDIAATNLGRWRDGTVDPTLDVLEQIAIALGRPVIDLLIAAAYMKSEDVGGRTVLPLPAPSVTTAIELDPEFVESERAILRAAVTFVMGTRNGTTEQRTAIKIE